MRQSRETFVVLDLLAEIPDVRRGRQNLYQQYWASRRQVAPLRFRSHFVDYDIGKTNSILRLYAKISAAVIELAIVERISKFEE